MRKQAKEEAAALAKMGASLSDRRVKHGVMSWIDARRLPSGRAFRKTRQQLILVREDLINRYGGAQIVPEALILIESIIDDLGVKLLAALYIRKVGPVSQKSIKEGALALHPLLGSSYLGYSNAITRNLLALKEFMPDRDRSQAELEKYLTSFSTVDEPEQAEKGPTMPQDGQTAGGEGNTMGDDQADDKGQDPLIDIKKGGKS